MADRGGGGPSSRCGCGKDIDVMETHCYACGHSVSPAPKNGHNEQENKKKGMVLTLREVVDNESVKTDLASDSRCEEPMDTEDDSPSPQPSAGQDAEKKEQIAETATGPKPPVCEGASGKPCNAPIDPAKKYCLMCGLINKYVQCQGSRKDTGALCKMLVEPSTSCPCCGRLAETETAATVMTKHVVSMDINLRPEGTELRAKPESAAKSHPYNLRTREPDKNLTETNKNLENKSAVSPSDSHNGSGDGKEQEKSSSSGMVFGQPPTGYGNLKPQGSSGKNEAENETPSDPETSRGTVSTTSVNEHPGAVKQPDDTDKGQKKISNGSKGDEDVADEVDAAAATTSQKDDKENANQSTTTKTDSEKVPSDSVKEEQSESTDGSGKEPVHQAMGEGEGSERPSPHQGHQDGEEDKKTDEQEVRDKTDNAGDETGYRKQDKPEENLVDGTKKKKAGKKNKNNKQENKAVATSPTHAGASAGNRRVHFHVVLHKGFDYNRAKDSVCIRFGREHLGGWTDKKNVYRHKMKEMEIHSGYVLFELVVDMPPSVYGEVQYKYVFLHQSDKKKDPTYLFEWRQNTGRERQNRTLLMNLPDGQCLPQYDGLMYPPPEDSKHGIMQTLKSWGKTIIGTTQKEQRDEVKEVTLAMLPRWHYFYCQSRSGQNFLEASADEVVQCIDSIFSYMEKSFGTNDQQTKSKAWKEILWQYLKPWKEQMTKQLQANSSNGRENAEMRLVSALCVLQLMCKLEGQVLAELTDLDIVLECLLLQPDDSGKILPFKEIVARNFKDKNKSVLGPLLSTTKWLLKHAEAKQSKTVQKSLYLVPLIHLLSEPPNAQMDYSDKHLKPEWWGVRLFAKEQERFKNVVANGNSLQLEFLLEKLLPLFMMDPLLPRTIMTMMNWQHLQYTVSLPYFPPDACIALCYHFIKVKTYVYTEDQEVMEKCLKVLVDKFNGLANTPPTNLQNDFATIELSAKIVCNVSLNLLKLMIEQTKYSSCKWHHERMLVTDVVGVLAAALRYFSHLTGTTFGQQNEGCQDVQQTVQSTCSAVVQWLRMILPSRIKESYGYGLADRLELEIFNRLLAVDFGIEGVNNYWQKGFMEFLSTRLGRVSPREQVELYCSCDQNHTLIEKLFSEAAFNVLNEVDILGVRSHDSSLSKYRCLVSTKFRNAWKIGVGDSENRDKILRHMLTWSSTPGYLEIYYNKNADKILFPELMENMARGASLLTDLYDRLVSFEVRVEEYQTIMSNKESFLTLCVKLKTVNAPHKTIDEDTKKLIKEDLSKFLNMRQHELNYYKEMCERLQLLVEACSTVSCVDIGVLQQAIQRDVSGITLRELVEPIPHDGDYGRGLPHPQIKAFHVAPEVIAVLDDIKVMRSSRVLKSIWSKFGAYQTKQIESAEDHLPIDLEEAVAEIWKPAWKEWLTLIQSLASGSTTLQDVDKYFGIFDGRNESIKKELETMSNCSGGSLDASSVLGKINLYHQLERFSAGAKAILQVKDEFQLTGDFSMIAMLANVEKNKKQTLNRMDKEILKTGKFLETITPEQITCLHVVGECKELITWLRDEIGGTKELKVFVDLASISAGEGDYNMDRVHMLHSVITGYAPLICDLKKDASAEIFLRHCEMVWAALKTDKKLPTKLRDTQALMDWLKFVKDSHGSVEVSSLSEADAINARGIYKVGNIDKGYKRTEDVIQLIVPAEKEGEKAKQYSFEQLNELQSKLMLVSTSKRGAEGDEVKHDVDRFTEIFERVTALAKAYIKICIAGNVLFQDWVCTFFCDPAKDMNVLVNIQLESGILMDKNRGEISIQIHDLALFMEKCLEEWQEHLNQQRSTFPHLNHFTTSQIVTLRGEFARIRTKEPVDVTTYDMLHNIKRDCSYEDLVASVGGAENFIRDAATKDRKPEADDDDDDEEEMPSNVMEVLEKITEGGASEKLARLAIKECGLDVDECTLWCWENGDKENDDDDGVKGGDDDSQSSDSDDEIAELLRNVDELQPSMRAVTSKLYEKLNKSRGICDQLRDLWHGFLDTVGTSVKDYLSVKHLGLILDALSDRELSMVKRSFPPVLETGRPNLIVCPEAEVYNTTLTLYMHDKPEKVPLPSDDEILLCTSHTTAEEVDLLWHRATTDSIKQGKIFCLVNADLLDYDVSDQVEKSLDRYIKGKADFRLVIICSSEREDTSRIVTALDRDRRHLIPRTAEQVLTYLQQQFKKDFESCEGNSAAKVEFEKLSVRLVKSARAGVGKSLLVKKRSQALGGQAITVRLHKRHMTDDDLVETLIHKRGPIRKRLKPTLFHIDIGHDVVEGVDHVLFNLLILRCIKDVAGRCWRRHPSDLYMIENLPLLKQEMQRTTQAEKVQYVHQMLNILPSVTCRPPKETLAILRGEHQVTGTLGNVVLIYDEICRSQEFTRPFHQLRLMAAANPQPPPPFYWLGLLLDHCGVENGDPSWSELHNFTSFLNTQLADAEESAFCSESAQADLPGFAVFVVKFMVQMSKDFATRSLMVSEETPQLLQPQVRDDDDDGDDDNEDDNDDDDLLALRRRWETSPHPYIFFNPDGHSFTFLGFNIDKQTGNLIDSQTKQILNRKIMTPQLFDALIRNEVNLKEDFDALGRGDKIIRLCTVMGLDEIHDPDETYELTTDNVKKMLAIYMRFRCGIPVVVMGETGCGKTRLIKFMCDLQSPPGDEGEAVKNLVLMKVHGGTTHADIIKKVREAQDLAAKNKREYPKMFTILFFDEANTTEAIGLIKEIMCDHSMNGESIDHMTGLKFVAACNPYRKHTPEMIKRLEQAGLGYNVKADKTADKLGRVPMRHLVYRVQPLPQSMLPLVWDFGQLSDEVEKMYIKQIVQRYMDDEEIPNNPETNRVITNILAASQCFMRKQENECSFVSLRDVERTLNVMAWFYANIELIGELMDEEEDDSDEDDDGIDDVTRSLILALGVCYHACLQDQTRATYREFVAEYFEEPCTIPSANCLLWEISRCQDMFLEQSDIQTPNIAPNQALKENLFMMVVCIELRIPLFLVGKPGSSKSLAKVIVNDAMQGETAKSGLFKSLKQVHMVSFQCSPLATPDGIKGTFNQCAMFQEGKNLDRFVSVVVLDEVGLAEDSPRMPLKTLHPLLEDGTCGGDDEPADYKKVAFVGISNWALDPAKMNRGILVQRDIPDEEELIKSAEGICSTDKQVFEDIKPMIPRMARAYLKLYNSTQEIREFFGLRDFYSLVKMVYAFADKSKRAPTWHQLEHAVRRNFGGIENVNPVKVFNKAFPNMNRRRQPDDPKCDPEGLIKACLEGDGASTESRYLLILTENYAALGILKQHLLSREDLIVIFGSSFRSDQEYTQVCRNINRIKKCMETGKTVVLLNLESLYESLYDALNQYYVYMGGERYVDLGLGTHRVKCRVDKKFRLIVVAEKEVVYEKFPIPLINRLEKHVLAMTTMLSGKQIGVAKKVEKWVKDYVTPKFRQPTRRKTREIAPGDVFCGYHDDTAASIVLQVSKEINAEETGVGWPQKVFDRCKELLLMCATAESVVRLKDTVLESEGKELFNKYFLEQAHGSLPELVSWLLKKQTTDEGMFLEVTTKSHLLAEKDARSLSRSMGLARNFKLLALQAMGTKQQFSRELSNFFKEDNNERLMLLQCDSGDRNSNLIACARYQIMEEYTKAKDRMVGKVHFVFIIQMPRVMAGSFIGFQGGKWCSVYLDDLRTCKQLAVLKLSEQSIGDLVREALEKEGVLTAPRPGPQTPKGAHALLNDEYLSRGGPLTPPLSPESVIDIESIDLENHENWLVEPSPEVLREVLKLTGQKAQEHVGCSSRDTQAVESDGPDVLDVNALILSCIQSAASMVKDSEGVPNKRPTKRLHIILEELSNKTDVVPLMTAMKMRVNQLLQEKEDKTSIQTLARDWLCKEAAAAESINHSGTFRKAVQMVMEKKFTPILAGIVAYIDTNCNLDILKRKETQHIDVIRKLWLLMLAESQVTKLSYDQFRSPRTHVEMTEIVAAQTGSACHLFKPQFPFSWEIFSQMQLIIQTAGTEGEDMEQTCLSLFNDSQCGKFLTNFLEEQSATVKDELMELYLKDFVHLCFKVDDVELEKMLMKTLKIAFREICQSMQLPGEEVTQLTIPKLHLTYARFRERLDHFIDACSIWPQCMTTLQEKSDHELNETMTEMTLDVGVLVHMIEYINGLVNKLKDRKGRKTWIEEVKTLKPVIERIMQQASVNSTRLPLGPKCKEYMDKYRPLWTRICVVQLFIDHVCPPHIKDEASRVDSMGPLWMFLRNDSNFKKASSVEKVAQFLITCKNKYVQKFYKTKLKCQGCKEIKKDPVKLLCDHSLCRDCLRSQIEADSLICLVCKKAFPDDFRMPEEASNPEADIPYSKYINASNKFFMDLISQLSFAEDSPPEKEVVDILMTYVIHDSGRRSQTKELTVYEECIDPTPVLRSLLLQLLLRYNTDEVRQHLQLYFERSQRFLENPEHIIQLSLLCARCFEDSYHSQCSSQSRDVLGTRMTMAIGHLEAARNDLEKEVLDITKVESIAKTRFGLSVAAEMMYRVHVEEEEGHDMGDVRRLCHAAQRVHDHCGSKWPRLYLVKQLCRTYGMDCLQQVSRVHSLQWILPEEAREHQNDTYDRFILFGDVYTKLRDSLVKVTLGESDQEFVGMCKNLNGKHQVKEVACLLALHREVFTQNKFEENVEHRINNKIIDNLVNVCANQNFMKNVEAVQDILERSRTERLGPNPFRADNTTKEINDLLKLYNMVMQSWKKVPALLRPLKAIMSEPQKMVASYLPIMPEDHLEEVRQAILANRKVDQNPVFYACSNGHPYIIGDCGRPYQVAQCRECGVRIGGANHKAEAGNSVLSTRDNTQTGHILGRADMHDLTPIPERNLSPAVTVILRLLLHMSMHIGTTHDAQAVAAMINPAVGNGELCPFLFEHIRHDIQLLGRALAKSPDDCLTIITLLISRGFMEDRKSDARPNLELNSKVARRDWERAFSQQYLNPLLQGLEETVKTVNGILIKDERLSNNPLIKIVHEVITYGDDVDVNQIHDSHIMWQHRNRVTVDHLTQLMNENARGGDDESQILRHFLQEEHHLRAMCHLPAIMKLQQLLVYKYQHRVNQADARLITIAKFLDEYRGTQRKEVKNLIDHFADAWKCIKETLPTYIASGYTLPREYCDLTVEDKTPISMLIPSQQGHGLCSIMLVEFLTRKHNEFIMAYCRFKDKEYGNLPEFSVKEASPAHLISYNPEKDLLPMVIAHCNYSLEVGRGTVISYDFKGIERQLEERLLRGKPKLRFEISSIVFRGDYNTAVQFQSLQSKIRQEPLSHAIQMQIIQESRLQYQGLGDSLANLDIAIHFLLSVGGDPNMTLITFTCDTLKMERNIFTSQIRQHCQLTHVQSLWLLLNMERSRQMHYFKQDPFDNIAQDFHEALEPATVHTLQQALLHLNIDTFVTELHECILLNINAQQNRNEDDAVDNAEFSLADVMTEYIDSKDGREIPLLTRDAFPRDILVKHAVAVWTEAVALQNKEELGRRR